MLRYILIALACLAAAPALAKPLEYTRGELLIAMDDPALLEASADGTVRSTDPRLGAVLERYGLERAQSMGRAPVSLASKTSHFMRLTSTRADFNVLSAAAELRSTGLFRSVVPDYHLRLFATVPNDPYLDSQWYVNAPGPAPVHLPEAWDVARGDTGVVIAIMDTGVDLTHPDLASQIWTNRAEIPGNGVDDDGNGFVDDVHGWDFGNGDNDPNPHATLDPSGIDIGFHGTFVAGIAAAATDNGDGIAGAGWHCRIMPLKVVDLAGDITLDAVTAAFHYAAAMHPAVLNMSFGAPPDSGVAAYFQALVDLATAANIVCVAAAGNDGTSDPNYPAACANVISVAATTDANARADFSNWGSTVDIAAPGAGMWSTICQNYVVDDLSQIIYLLYFGWDGTNPYMLGDGTSFSSPLVAGVCGLIRARFPSMSPQQVAQQLVITGDPVAYDEPIGPKLNAFRAVSAPAAAVGPEPTASFELALAGRNPFVSSTVLRFAIVEPGEARLAIFDCEGRLVRELVRGTLAPGAQTVRWEGVDSAGRPLGSGVYFARLEVGGRVSSRKLVLMR